MRFTYNFVTARGCTPHTIPRIYPTELYSTHHGLACHRISHEQSRVFSASIYIHHLGTHTAMVYADMAGTDQVMGQDAAMVYGNMADDNGMEE